MKKIFNAKGFTLIELLVVIAIIGILAAVVLIAIDPAERIKEANDSGVKSNVGQVQTAVESCFTQTATGNYGGCLTMADLVSKGFIKQSISGVTISPATGTPATVTITGALAAKSAKCDAGSGNTKTFTYSSATGVTRTVCS